MQLSLDPETLLPERKLIQKDACSRSRNSQDGRRRVNIKVVSLTEDVKEDKRRVKELPQLGPVGQQR